MELRNSNDRVHVREMNDRDPNVGGDDDDDDRDRQLVRDYGDELKNKIEKLNIFYYLIKNKDIISSLEIFIIYTRSLVIKSNKVGLDILSFLI